MQPPFSGGERTRTADFYVANVVLYQLSYTPAFRPMLAGLMIAGTLVDAVPTGLDLRLSLILRAQVLAG